MATSAHLPACALSIKDLNDVLELIWDARTEWINIGLHLRMHYPDLLTIKERNQSDPNKCFREMISEWLTLSERPTLSDIATALKAQTVNYCELAIKVEERSAKESSEPTIVPLKCESEDILFDCPCHKCTLDSYVSEGCCKSSIESGSYPYLKMEAMNDGDREDLIQTLNNDTTKIIKHYADLLITTSQSLKKKGTTVHELAHAALAIGRSTLVGGDTQKPLLQEERELIHATTIDEAFIILGRSMSFFNYEILDQIISSCGTDEDKERLKAYEKALECFCERKTFEVSPNVFQNSQTGRKGRKAFLVMITKNIEFSLNDVKAQKDKLATILGLRSSTLQIHRIDEGSIVILFSIPESIARHIFPLPSSKVAELETEDFHMINVKPHYLQKTLMSSNPYDEVLSENLTADYYKPKFCILLDSEEKVHSEILENRCNGEYCLYLHQFGSKQLPHSASKEVALQHVRYGFLEGLNSDKIAYAVQAAQQKQGVIVYVGQIEVCKADILPNNYKHTDDKMYIGFDRQNNLNLRHSPLKVCSSPTSFNATVKFELKHSYFDSLRKFVRSIPEDVIRKLIPVQKHFKIPFRKNSTHFEHCKPLCSLDQFEALEAIAFSPSNGPPVLIAGPFGTGKTHTLAVAVNALFHEGILTNQCLRVLVCTHHKRSTDNFLEIFESLSQHFALNRRIEKFLIRKYKVETTSRQIRKFCISPWKIVDHINSHSKRNNTNLLFVTTCMSCSDLKDLNGFFTHIMIDEGAQMREPEAIAPLCLATENTKIVITGDQQQVGPSMLVLSDQARQYGLDKSLMERLCSLYQQLSEAGAATEKHLLRLSTNYRCHPALRNFVRQLFYRNFDLKSPQHHKLPSAHPKYSKCLLFVCSGVEENIKDVSSNFNEKEAMALLQVLKHIAFFNWPGEWGKRDLHQCCIMSPSRSQLTIINQITRDWKKRFTMLEKVSCRPTYDIQGHEFRAIFLSTSEVIASGEIVNPTKSFSNQFVFNTAITRAQSLVVGVGNPFLLLEMEKHMIEIYGYSENGKCWSSFLKECLSAECVKFDESLSLTKDQKEEILIRLERAVEEQIRQKPLNDKNSLMRDAVLLSSNFPPLTSLTARKRKKKKHSRRRRKEKADINNEAIDQQETRLSFQVPVSDLVTESEVDDPPPLCQANIDSEKESRHTCMSITLPSPTARSRFKEEFEIIEKLSSGNQTTEFHVLSSTNHSNQYKIKIISLPTSEHDREKINQVAKCIAELDHPHIVKCYSWWIEYGWSAKTLSEESPLQSDAVLMTQLELVENYTLQDWLKHHSLKRRKSTVINFFEQLLDVVNYISDRTHQSLVLKPSDIYLDPNKDDFLKVCATRLIPGYSSGDTDDYLYMSSEMEHGLVANGDIKADSYSLGVILFESHCSLATKEEKYKVLTGLKEDGIPSRFRAVMHNEVTCMIQLLMNKNPSMRPSVKEMIDDRHGYLKILKQKIKKSKNSCIPVVSFVKEKRKHISKIADEHISVLSDHLFGGPPAPFQIECPVCQDIVTVPFQVDCCGKVFCQKCLKRVREGRLSCPTCNQDNYKLHQDKGLEKALEHLKVHCRYCEAGCSWTGKLNQLDNHLNRYPFEKRQLEGCQFVEIKCLHCSRKFHRSTVKDHQDLHCDMRPFTCQYCREHVSTYKDVEENHWPKCKDYLISCEYKCGEIIPRRDYKNHIVEKCMEVTETCTLGGCTAVIQRKDMLSHIIENHLPQTLRSSIHQSNQLQLEASERKYNTIITKLKQTLQRRGRSVQYTKSISDVCSREKLTSSQRYRYSNNFEDAICATLNTNQPSIRLLLEPPPESFQDLIECPVCLKIAKEPYQLLCCGKNICKQCLDSFKAKHQQCPSCRGTIDTFFNKGLRHVLSEVYTQCPYKHNGCEWKGKMGDVDAHLNSESYPNPCKYAKVKCTDCGSIYQRYYDAEHKLNDCSERLITCKYCKSYKGTFTDVSSNHMHVCEHFILQCPRKCGTFVERHQLSNHLSKKCPMRKHFNFWPHISSANIKWFMFLLIHFSPLLLVFIFLTTQTPHELVGTRPKFSGICQQWNMNTMTIQLTFSNISFAEAIVTTYCVTNMNPEWNEEFEFYTKMAVVSRYLLNSKRHSLRVLQNTIETCNNIAQVCKAVSHCNATDHYNFLLLT